MADHPSKWIEFADIVAKPPEWGASHEAKDLADRITENIRRGGELYFSVPVARLTVDDGVFGTQLLALAKVYAATGNNDYKQAFLQGIKTLLSAQFRSGLWPTTYPRDIEQDLIKDKFAKDSWTTIPSLFRMIIERQAPFDSDVAESIDPKLLQAALDRVPPREHITPFSFSAYEDRNQEWWAADEARQMAENLLTWQMNHGGFERIYGMAYVPFSPPDHKYRGTPFGDGVERGDFLRGRTTEPLRFLAKVYEATGDNRYRAAFRRGLEFVLAAQYESGGWPRHYPLVGNDPQRYPFNNAITFYYSAMVYTLRFLQDILAGHFSAELIDDAVMPRIQEAFDKGINCIVSIQIEVDGKRTAWAQRYNPVTLEPQAGRTFEPVAINSWASVGIVQLLMSIPNPSPAVKEAILSALEWFLETQLPDGRWAMFYEIGTMRPIFAGRDGIVRYSLSEIELERQLGYVWYGSWPEELMQQVKQSGYLDELRRDLAG